MEASQQQRGSTVGQFAKTLADADLVFDAIDLADILWLAQFIEPGGKVLSASSDTALDPVQPINTPSSTVSATNETTLDLYSEDSFSPQPESKSEESESEQKEITPEQPKGTPFSVPAAPALRTRMDLARALRPLMRKVPSRTRFDLDEDATVTQIAEIEVWMPVVCPTSERWLELDLVVESSKTTVIWERAIAELNHLAEYQGAFRAVRTWRLSADGDRLQLFPRWRDGSAKSTRAGDRSNNARPHTPKELIDFTGRRLIWLVTDCTSLLWRNGLIYKALQEWTTVQPVAIVQMFPDSLWKRTALRDGHQVKLSALAPGLPSARLEVDGLPRRLEQRSRSELVTIPVVTLDAIAMHQWARVVAGVGDSRSPGRVFDLAFIERQQERQSAHVASGGGSRPTVERSAQERVDLFRATTASKTVKHLANLMAATPVSLPVIDLLREAFRADFEEEVRQSHVAEVLLSGLLRRCDTEAEEVCRYEFWGDDSSDPSKRVRDILLGDSSVSKSLKVLNALSASICQKIDSPVKSFQALLKELDATDKKELQDAALPFARVGLDVLHRLGGEHAALAQRYEQMRRGDLTRSDIDWPDFPLERFEYEVAEYLNLPPLEPFNFIDAQFEEFPVLITDDFTIITVELQPQIELNQALERFNFTVATLVRDGSDWRIQRQQNSAYRFAEDLSSSSFFGGIAKRLGLQRISNTLNLEMVSIPGNTFIMGSPEDELDRSSNESPQHEVTVLPFFMSRYPITQAQWQAVAQLPQVNRKLKPNPSRFKGDNRPIEKVSWHDAVEFCERLSIHTQRQYRLPTEAEWEYACRAGTTTPYHFGEMITADLASFSRSYEEGTTPVRQYGVANAFGLCDMHGNVWEWCQDHWHETYEGAPTDGIAWIEGGGSNLCVRRGGSWYYDPGYCRSAFRLRSNPDIDTDGLGFRVCCSPPRAVQ